MSGKDYFAAGGRDRRKRSEDELISFDTLNLETVERETILKALQMSKWVQKGAASLLGVSPRALNYKINQHDITHPSWKKNREPLEPEVETPTYDSLVTGVTRR